MEKEGSVFSSSTLGVARRRMNVDVCSPIIKADIGSPYKQGRKSAKYKREQESLQNIANGKQATMLEFTPRKK